MSLLVKDSLGHVGRKSSVFFPLRAPPAPGPQRRSAGSWTVTNGGAGRSPQLEKTEMVSKAKPGRPHGALSYEVRLLWETVQARVMAFLLCCSGPSEPQPPETPPAWAVAHRGSRAPACPPRPPGSERGFASALTCVNRRSHGPAGAFRVQLIHRAWRSSQIVCAVTTGRGSMS